MTEKHPFDHATLIAQMKAQEEKNRHDSICDSQIEDLEDQVKMYTEWLQDWRDFKEGKTGAIQPQWYDKYPNG